MVLAAALAVSFAACGTATPSDVPSAPSSVPTAVPSGPASPASGSPSASSGSVGPSANPDVVALARTILDQTAQIRQLPIKKDVPPIVLSEADLKAYTERMFHEENPPDVVAANDKILKGLGLIPESASLEQLYLDLLGSQVAGFYSPDDQKLYVVARAGAIGPAEKVTLSHEYTHALQDQSFNLKGLGTDQVGEGDRALGRLALVEGDATLEMTYWSQQHLTQQELVQLGQDSMDPEALRILTSMPAILRETLLFPYQAGLSFALGLQAQGGWSAVDRAYAKPPASTEQVMHPEKYVAGEMPVDVKLPGDLAKRMGDGWKVSMEDTFGEFQLGVWLREAGKVPARTATDAAAGWGGDRVGLLEGPNGAWGIALVTAWDTADDATQFADAANATVTALGRSGGVTHQPGTKAVVVVLGSDDSVAGALDRILGATGA